MSAGPPLVGLYLNPPSSGGLCDGVMMAQDDARPILFSLYGADCRKPELKGLVRLVNSIYNGSRFEDLWLDK